MGRDGKFKPADSKGTRNLFSMWSNNQDRFNVENQNDKCSKASPSGKDPGRANSVINQNASLQEQLSSSDKDSSVHEERKPKQKRFNISFRVN